ncbi:MULTISPECIES: thiol reductant ABC exporter subunit CydC [unclassified Xanthobacter]|uniref:thiol reductant ABC exporter subunit CydC n=1 Tax=unclassified Xanthobacter TaxID=2623496 RepID=UPI001F2410B3|nr:MULTISPECIES: thiol reductant ABC exporter subunit CydC [unclassified Xanthobacter]
MKDFLRLVALMRPQALWMGVAVLLSAFASLAHMALMATSGWFITAMALAGAAGIAIDVFAPAAYIRGFAIARTLSRYIERLVGHQATLKFVASLRPWFFVRLTPLAPAALQDQRSGDLLARLKGDIDRLEFAFLRVISPVAAALIVLAVGLAFIAGHDEAMALAVAGAALFAGLVLPLLVQRLAAPAARAVTAHGAELNAALVDHLEGRAELDIYDPNRRHRAAVDATSNTLIASEGRLAGIAGFAGAGVGLAAQAALLAVILIGAPRVLGGSLPGPDLVMLALFSLALFEAVAPLPLAFQTLPGTLASARRIFALVDRPAPVAEPAAPKPVPARGALAFSHVGLTYPGAHAPALEDVSFTLEPGRRIGIIGESGSGKSSLVALALRFRASGTGEVRFADDSVAAYDTDALRARLAVLAQGDHLFSATIRENLAIAAPGADDAALKGACAKAGILAFVESQPEGLDTFVGAHGAKVSGGEARRLGLARALLKDAPILILDEPTEGLDTETERRVMSAVLEVTEGRALLLISHRRARLDAMDEIIVMAEGRITARGAPASILRDLDGAPAP